MIFIPKYRDGLGMGTKWGGRDGIGVGVLVATLPHCYP